MTDFRINMILLVVLLGCFTCKRSGDSVQPNFLFIAIDDLRPELGAYGAEYIHSPHLDRLAAEGFLFRNHQVVVPTCGASRYALLTGLLPRSSQHLRNDAFEQFMARQPETERPESFVHHLRRQGYRTVGIGKISHSPDGFIYGYQEPVSEVREMPHSWDEFLFDPGKWGTGHNAFFGYADGSNRNDLEKQVLPYEAADVPDEGYPDGLTARLATEKIAALAKADSPFFLAVGFFKPHLPFNAPQKYWDLYDRKDIPLSPTPDLPRGIDPASLHGSGEFNQYALGAEKAGLDRSLSDDYARLLRHAYAASVSYIDAQVGKLVKALEENELDENTVIVVWGDHGWHLGDHRVWGKHTVFDWALRSAFLLKIPGQEQAPQVFDQIVSSVDIYPTILDLCGIETALSLDGQSLTPLWEEPYRPWGNTAYSYFRRGISLRTDRYRLTRYFRPEEPTVELYDHTSDPYETRNIAHEHPEKVDSLLRVWNKGHTFSYPR